MRGPGTLSMRGSRFRGAQWLRGRRAQITRGAGLQGARWLPDADRKRRRRKQEAFPSRPPEPPLWPRIGCGLSRGPRARRNWRLFRCRPCVFTAAGARLWLQFILDVRGSTSSSGLEKNGVQGPGRQDAAHGHWAPHVVQRPLGLRDPYGSPGPCIPDRASSGKLRMNRAQGSVRNSGLFGAGVH